MCPSVGCKLQIQPHFFLGDHPVIPIPLTEQLYHILPSLRCFIYYISHHRISSISGFSVSLVCLLRHQDHSYFNYSGSVFKYLVCWLPLLPNRHPFKKVFFSCAYLFLMSFRKKKNSLTYGLCWNSAQFSVFSRVALLTTFMRPYSFHFIL